jgi:hypothetical protein
MTSDVGTSAAQVSGPALLARQAANGAPTGPSVTGLSPADASMTDPGSADLGPAGGLRRRARAALLNAGAPVVTTAAIAAFEPKLPRYVGD